ncbi:MAG TPA: DUF3467 domain-containing protein [Solirubrobacteraceae bacterium]|nr:DUF3467 domain-containing protein [Solirubrobacteraceae bacterium]
MADPDAPSSEEITPIVYANHVGFGGTATDATIAFSLRTPSTKGSEKQGVVTVHLPWEVALALREMLTAGVERYEGDFGPVRNVTKRDENDEDSQAEISTGNPAPT